MMTTLAIVLILIVLLTIVTLYYYNIKLRKQYESIIDLTKTNKELKRQFENREQIFETIANALNSTSLESVDEFHIKINKLANIFRTTFKSEYCAIGKLTDKDGKLQYEDFTFDYELKESNEDQIKQEEVANKVKGVDTEDPGYFITTALKDKSLISYFDKDKIQERKKKNQHFEFYEKFILKSGQIVNTTVVNIISEDTQNTIGYIQFINTDTAIVDEDLKPFVKNLTQLIQFSITEKENAQIKLEKEQLSKDFEFIMCSIKNEIYDFEQLLDSIMDYFIKKFDVAIVSFRIPILNGKDRAIFYYLRNYKIDASITNKDKIIQHYKVVELLDYKKVGSYQKMKCYLPEEFFIGDLYDSNFCEGTVRPINTEKCIILPVFKDMSISKCLAGNEHQCNFDSKNECRDKYQNLFGIFRLRVYKDKDISNNFFQERLRTFSSLLNFLFDAIMDKNEADKIKQFQEEIEKINFKDTLNFEFQLASILRNVVRAKVCSIYRFRKDHEASYFEIVATTSKYRYNLHKGLIEEIKIPGNQWQLRNDGKNILSKAYQSELTKYLFNLRNPLGVDVDNIFNIFPEFLELSDYQYADSTLDDLKNESVFAIPMKDKETEIKGVILFVGKEHNKTTISTSFWEQDRMLVELFTNVISRFVDAFEADKKRETFLHQLGHELLSPITEIVYENNSLLNRFERDRFLTKEIAIKQLKDNLNVAMYFKRTLDDLEFSYGNIQSDSYNYEHVVNSKEIILRVVQMFEKKAHAEKQIAIRTNVSNMPPLYVDKDRIQQVCINLIKNAIQYSKEYTTINIYYNLVEANIDIQKDKKWHEITFVNEGIGIPEEDKEKVFDLYYRSRNAINIRPSGTGIGLYIVKKIMKAHHGDCVVKQTSNPTRIAIYFPYN